MGRYDEESTIPLWDEFGSKKISMKNVQSGRKIAFTLQHRCVLGRNKEVCDVLICEDDRYVSGKHFSFISDGSRIYVEDLHSKNGTWVNETLVTTQTRIHSGDRLRIGKTTFVVSF